VKASANEISRALDAATGDIRFFLLYGPDEAGSAALAQRLERAMGADAERIDLEGGELKSDPARLADEAASISLFGGKRWVRIQPAGDEITISVAGLLEAAKAGNPVVAIGGALRATSSLVKLATESKCAMVHASFVPDAGNATKIAETLARSAGLRMSGSIARTIATACGNDRAVMAQEIEKLALYLDAAPDRPAEATPEALDAIGAVSNDGELGKLVDAVMGGQPARAAGEVARLAQSGTEGIPLLRALFRRVVVLVGLRADIDAGMSPADAVEKRGKAIFFKERAGIADQAARWTAPRLATVADRLLESERALKSSGSAGVILADTEMLVIARAAAARRR
jgi:DNA polymerase-3 subunit delta